jgi:hypothetical protein
VCRVGGQLQVEDGVAVGDIQAAGSHVRHHKCAVVTYVVGRCEWVCMLSVKCRNPAESLAKPGMPVCRQAWKSCLKKEEVPQIQDWVHHDKIQRGAARHAPRRKAASVVCRCCLVSSPCRLATAMPRAASFASVDGRGRCVHFKHSALKLHQGRNCCLRHSAA